MMKLASFVSTGSSLTSLCFAAHTPGGGLALDADETKSPTNLNGESGGVFGDRCTLEYMFKNQQGQNIDLDKMRQRHNDYLDDYFESLDKEIEDKEGEMARFVEDTNASEIHMEQETKADKKNKQITSKPYDLKEENVG
nr:hypothetical protein [Tanacetum cinerariifolium]